MELMREKAKELALILDSRKAMDIRLLDVCGISSVTDYFLICTGTSSRHVMALADYVEDGMGRLELVRRHKEGHRTGDWIILDCSDIVVHIFTKDTRDYYGLERIWRDARDIELPLDTEMKAL